jgi:hypothetical protein
MLLQEGEGVRVAVGEVDGVVVVRERHVESEGIGGGFLFCIVVIAIQAAGVTDKNNYIS